MRQKNVGLLGGTFDPVHQGHLHLAEELKHFRKLDEVWFIPAKQNPFKKEKPLFSDRDRLKMLQLALLNKPHFFINEIEINKETSSYTIETVKALQKEHPEIHFSLLIGDDHLPYFHKWKNATELCHLLPIYTGVRYQTVIVPDSPCKEVLEAGLTPGTILEISSTELRARIQKREPISGLVPESVEAMIMNLLG